MDLGGEGDTTQYNTCAIYMFLCMWYILHRQSSKQANRKPTCYSRQIKVNIKTGKSENFL